MYHFKWEKVPYISCNSSRMWLSETAIILMADIILIANMACCFIQSRHLWSVKKFFQKFWFPFYKGRIDNRLWKSQVPITRKEWIIAFRCFGPLLYFRHHFLGTIILLLAASFNYNLEELLHPIFIQQRLAFSVDHCACSLDDFKELFF